LVWDEAHLQAIIGSNGQWANVATHISKIMEGSSLAMAVFHEEAANVKAMAYKQELDVKLKTLKEQGYAEEAINKFMTDAEEISNRLKVLVLHVVCNVINHTTVHYTPT
jgi:IMP cyclohydrolase